MMTLIAIVRDTHGGQIRLGDDGRAIIEYTMNNQDKHVLLRAQVPFICLHVLHVS